MYISRCKKCNKKLVLNPEEEPTYEDGNYSYKEWVYANNRILCSNCWFGEIIDSL